MLVLGLVLERDGLPCVLLAQMCFAPFMIAHFGMYSILMSCETCINQNLWRMLVKSPNSKFWSLTFVLFCLKVGGRNTS